MVSGLAHRPRIIVLPHSRGNPMKLPHRRQFLHLAVSAAAVPALSRFAKAQAYPTRYVRVVVQFPPGGAADPVARLLANRLSETWGQQVVVENKGGAGGNIGAAAVAQAAPDGYTLLVGIDASFTINPHIYASLGFDPIDLAPITRLCTFTNLMVVPNSSPAKSVMEFVSYAKANRGKITFASPGTGT